MGMVNPFEFNGCKLHPQNPEDEEYLQDLLEAHRDGKICRDDVAARLQVLADDNRLTVTKLHVPNRVKARPNPLKGKGVSYDPDRPESFFEPADWKRPWGRNVFKA